ncbi:MAG TPA: ABC transporter permease [Kouleothrix sp.]|nr:ABC transporter permease [Kouleothrix sp.]HRC74511.1 ABC transporter permease [Kouleothrix sp.]
MLGRIWALVQKECVQLARDRRTLIALLLGPAIELLLFAAAIHTDIRHIPLVVADQSLSSASRAYLAAFTESQSFDIVATVASQAALQRAIDSGQASMGIAIPPDFAAQLARGQASVLLLVDGSTSFISQSAVNAAAAISQQYAVGLLRPQGGGPLAAHLQILYNPDLKDTWFIAPAFIAMLLYALAEALTSLAIVRERERGTIEALLVTPVRPFELMVAKTIPSLLVTFASGLLLVAVGTLGLGVPFRGSLPLFLALSLIGAGCGLGLGLMISSAAQTQNQAQQMHSMIMMVGLFVGGVFFPTYALPRALHLLGLIFPTTYFIPIVRGMALKGAGIASLWREALALLALFGATLLVAARLFRQSLD